MKRLHNRYAIYYFRSYALRVIINVIAASVLIGIMHQSLGDLGTFDLRISRNHELNSDGALLSTAAYAFDEATIIIALSGLMAVVLIAMLSLMGTFVFSDKEPNHIFRIRLLFYTISHLLISLALTTYLVFCIAVIIQTNSLRLNDSTAFIWAYPTYAIVVIVYLIEFYSFVTKNFAHNGSEEENA